MFVSPNVCTDVFIKFEMRAYFLTFSLAKKIGVAWSHDFDKILTLTTQTKTVGSRVIGEKIFVFI